MIFLANVHYNYTLRIRNGQQILQKMVGTIVCNNYCSDRN